jgi:hypothetical protein
VKHSESVKKIVSSVLQDLGGVPGMEISTDGSKLALGVMDAIRTRYRSSQSSYTASNAGKQLNLEPQQILKPIEMDLLPSKDAIGEWK